MIEAWYEKKEQLDKEDEGRKGLTEPVEMWKPAQEDKAVIEITEIDVMEKQVEDDYQKVMARDKEAGKDLNTLAMYEYQQYGYRFKYMREVEERRKELNDGNKDETLSENQNVD